MFTPFTHHLRAAFVLFDRNVAHRTAFNEIGIKRNARFFTLKKHIITLLPGISSSTLPFPLSPASLRFPRKSSRRATTTYSYCKNPRCTSDSGRSGGCNVRSGTKNRPFRIPPWDTTFSSYPNPPLQKKCHYRFRNVPPSTLPRFSRYFLCFSTWFGGTSRSISDMSNTPCEGHCASGHDISYAPSAISKSTYARIHY